MKWLFISLFSFVDFWLQANDWSYLSSDTSSQWQFWESTNHKSWEESDIKKKEKMRKAETKRKTKKVDLRLVSLNTYLWTNLSVKMTILNDSFRMKEKFLSRKNKTARWRSTVLKFSNFPDTLILREINFANFGRSKNAILTILKALTFDV